MFDCMIRVACVMLLGLFALKSFAGPVSSATWTGATEFRSWSQAATCNTSVLNTTQKSGLMVIFR